MSNTQNLKPWKPGQSGNPGGRVRTKLITFELEQMLEQDAARTNGKTWAAVIAETGFFRLASCIEPLKTSAFRSRQTRVCCTPGSSSMNRSAIEIAG
jgi:hypothetical protein